MLGLEDPLQIIRIGVDVDERLGKLETETSGGNLAKFATHRQHRIAIREHLLRNLGAVAAETETHRKRIILGQDPAPVDRARDRGLQAFAELLDLWIACETTASDINPA